MTVPLDQFARDLNLHPFNALVFLRQIGLEFDEVWPNIDESLLETVRSMLPAGSRYEMTNTERTPDSSSKEQMKKLSEDAFRILDKLERHKYWGNNKIPKDKIKNHYCQNVPSIDPFIEELLQLALIIEVDSDTYTLNQARKREISALLVEYRSQHQG